LGRVKTLTAVGVRGWGWEIGGSNCIADHHALQSVLDRELPLQNITHEMYSLSFFVVRTSGSFPNRPTRISLATSAKRDEDVEKAYSRSDCQRAKWYKHRINTYASRCARCSGRTNNGEHCLAGLMAGRRRKIRSCLAVCTLTPNADVAVQSSGSTLTSTRTCTDIRFCTIVSKMSRHRLIKKMNIAGL